MTRNLRGGVFGLILSIALVGCAKETAKQPPEIKFGQTAIAQVKPAAGQSVTGMVTFTQQTHGVLVIADIKNLTPGSHGFHIHENGDLSAPDLKSAGPHFNPSGQAHGGPGSESHHAGDLGNLQADVAGNAHLETTLHGVRLADGPTSIVGRSVIIHASPDDLKSQPAGNSGARIAGGVIVLNQP